MGLLCASTLILQLLSNVLATILFVVGAGEPSNSVWIRWTLVALVQAPSCSPCSRSSILNGRPMPHGARGSAQACGQQSRIGSGPRPDCIALGWRHLLSVSSALNWHVPQWRHPEVT